MIARKRREVSEDGDGLCQWFDIKSYKGRCREIKQCEAAKKRSS